MQFIVEKVKETETGGKRHDKDDYSSLMFEHRNGFLGYWDSNGDNPMYAAIKNRQGLRAQQKGIEGVSPADAFDAPEDEDFDQPF